MAMGNEEKLKIIIEAQNKAQAAFREAQKQIDDTEKKFGGAMAKMDAASAKMKTVGSNMSKYMTLPILAGAGVSIKAFSDLQETLNKVDVSFGSQAGAVKEWSKSSIKNMGMAQQSALDMVSLFGDMGTGMGQTKKEAAKMGMELSQRAADLASFKNISFERAQSALTGIYTGETEALKGLGVAMTETNLNAFAVANGLIKVDKNSTAVKDAAMKQTEAQGKLSEMQRKHGKTSTEAAKAQIELEKATEGFDKAMQGNTINMTQAEKIMLRQKFVMDATKNSAGDFGNTSDSLANKQRTATEKAKQLSAELGGKLAPVYAKLLGVGTKVLDWFSKLSSGQQDLIVKAALVVAAIGPVVRIMGSLVTGVKGVASAGKTAFSVTTKLAGAASKYGKIVSANAKFLFRYGKYLAKENILKAAATAKTVALTIAEKAKTVVTKIGIAVQAAWNAILAINPVFLIVAAIVGLIAVMVLLYKKNEAVRNFIDKAWRSIAAVFMTVFNAIKGAISGVIDWIKNNWKLLLGIVLGPLALIVMGFIKYKTQIAAVFQAIWNVIKVVWNGIVTVIKWAWENVIKNVWNAISWSVTNLLIPGFKMIWSVIQTVWNAVVTVIKWAWENVIKPLWEAISSYITNTLMPAFQKIWDKVKAVFDKVVEIIKGAWTNVKAGFDKVKGWITSLIEKFAGIKEKIASAFSTVGNAIKAPFKTAFNWIANGWNKTLGKLSFTIPSWVPKMGGKKFDMPNMPTLYTGARNFRGGPAIVGDIAGRGGEIVNLPGGTDVFSNRESKQIMRSLADGKGGGGGGTMVTNTFTGNIFLADANAVEKFFKELNRQAEMAAMGVAS